MAKPDLQAEALRLRRRERLSLNELVKRFSGHVSKSTLSVWLRDHPLREDEREAKRQAGVRHAFAKGHPAARPVARVSDVFSKRPTRAAFHVAALGIAIEWYSSRGYHVSIPLDQVGYDLIVESDIGLKRVQVKSTTKKESNGSWSVQTCRNRYDAASALNAGGRRKRRGYTSQDIDLFFIVTGDRDIYLIPIELVEGQVGMVLNNKYSNFRSLA